MAIIEDIIVRARNMMVLDVLRTCGYRFRLRSMGTALRGCSSYGHAPGNGSGR